jgi:hypothetical protein
MVRSAAIRIAALAGNGLTFSQNAFDLERFRQLQEIAAELFATLSDRPVAEWRLELGRDVGYVTPKIEVRGALVDDQERGRHPRGPRRVGLRRRGRQARRVLGPRSARAPAQAPDQHLQAVLPLPREWRAASAGRAGDPGHRMVRRRRAA